jgi:hypothetical protein
VSNVYYLLALLRLEVSVVQHIFTLQVGEGIPRALISGDSRVVTF